MNEGLVARIETAIIKLRSARDAYYRIVEMCSDNDKKNEFYINNFSTIQEKVYSAVDILLGCFIEEKGITLWKFDNSSKTYVPLIGDHINTSDYCRAILFHNNNNPENQYLTNVDFNSILQDKNIRNIDEHKGIQKDLQDIYRVFLNLNYILSSLDSNINRANIILEDETNSFDFSRFDSCFGENPDDRRFILLADSIHNMEKNKLISFMRLPWSLILDFDGASDMGGLLSALDAGNIKHNSYGINYILDESNDISYMNRTIHIKMCDGDLRGRFNSSSITSAKDSKLTNKILTKIHDSAHPYVTIVILGAVTQRMGQLCTLVAGEFKETDIIILSKQDQNNAFIPLVTDEYDIENSDELITSVNEFDSSVFSALNSICNNIELLPVCDNLLYSDKNGYLMPGANLLDAEFIDRMSEDIEFIHCGLGKNLDEQKVDQFYHGDIISWTAISNRCADPIIGKHFEVFVREMMNAISHQCFYIYHMPGFGGTTLARQLIWEIHGKVPSIRLKQFCGRNEFKRLLNDLYHKFDNKLFWILVDENDVSSGDIDDIEREVKCGEYNVCALIVKRVTEKTANSKNRNKQSNELVLKLIEQDAQDILESKCYSILNDKALFDYRKQQMDINLENRQKCPLLINLYLLEDNFKLDTYVKSFLDKNPNDYDMSKMRKLIAFIAIGSYYSNIKIPSSYCKQYLKFKSIELDMSCFEGVVLKKTMNSVTYYCINHYLIAEEILVQTLSEDKIESEKFNLTKCIYEYIDWLVDLSSGLSIMDENIIEIISALFTDKTQSSHLESNDDYFKTYTFLLESLGEYQRLDVISYLADKMTDLITKNSPRQKNHPEYRLLAHIYAQQARIRLKSNRVDENNESDKTAELDDFINRTKNLIVSENICEYALEDILARCSLERARFYRESIEGKIDENDLKSILKYVDDAIEHFSYTIWYGSPDYGVPGKMEALILGLSTLVEYNNWPEKNRLTFINSNQKAQNYLDIKNSVFDDFEERSFSSISYTLATKRKEMLENIIYPEKESVILQNLDDFRNNLDPMDYDGHYFVSKEIVYAYERKYYDEVFRRASLINKSFRKDKKAIQDADHVFDNLDRIVKMSVNHQVAHVIYNKWFEYAKYKNVGLIRAKEVAREWRDAEIKRSENRDTQYSTLLKPYYYLFVISLLQYKSGVDGVTDSEVRERKENLRSEVKKSHHTRAVQDWYRNATGLGQLFSHEWIDYKDVQNEDQIAVVQGSVKDIDDNYVGYIKITNPRSLGNWSKPLVGHSYNKDSYVRFVEEQSGIISKRDSGTTKEWKFKFGFSYENFEASMNSLEFLNGGYKQKTADKASVFNMLTPTQDEFDGYLVKFIPGKRCGFIVGKNDYSGLSDGTLYFNAAEIKNHNDYDLNTYKAHYLVTYDYENKEKTRVKNIRIVGKVDIKPVR